jgi:hypothetical protein
MTAREWKALDDVLSVSSPLILSSFADGDTVAFLRAAISEIICDDSAVDNSPLTGHPDLPENLTE